MLSTRRQRSITLRLLHSIHWWIGDAACNYRVLCEVYDCSAQTEQGSIFFIFSTEINITKRYAEAPADHKAKVAAAATFGSGRQGNDLVIWEGKLGRKRQLKSRTSLILQPLYENMFRLVWRQKAGAEWCVYGGGDCREHDMSCAKRKSYIILSTQMKLMADPSHQWNDSSPFSNKARVDLIASSLTANIKYWTWSFNV